MRSAILVAACAALVKAQDLDWDAIIAAGPASTVSVPVVYVTTPGATTTQTATTVAYTEAAAVSSVAAAMSADPSDAAPLDSDVSRRMRKRDLRKRVATTTTATTCIAQPSGSGPVPTDDSASAFLAYPAFSSSASAQPTPSGYVNTFTNLQASNNAYGYMGYTLLSEYSSQKCADKCTAINGCQAFNIYFERDPSKSPDPTGCPNPPSTTQIKCVFWGGPVDSANANNAGQYQSQFQVVIAGSNGYVNQSIAQPKGFNEGIYLGSSAINAPLDCAGDNTYLQGAFFNAGPFNAQLCAAACTAQSDYAYAHPPSSGSPKACKFFNTYLLYKNGEIYGQNCAMYSEAWTSTVATNTGYYYGTDKYTVAFSYTFSNSTDAGSPRIACDVASASSVIGSSTLQPFCSTLLGYSNLATTTTTTVTPLSTLSTVATFTSTDYYNEKRALSTPAALTKFKASAITSACSLQATKQTSTVTSVVTSTAATSVITAISSTTTTVEIAA